MRVVSSRKVTVARLLARYLAAVWLAEGGGAAAIKHFNDAGEGEEEDGAEEG